MSRNKKVFIAIGILLVIAHFASLALAFNSSRKQNNSSEASTPWTDKMGEWMSFLAPRVDVNYLLCKGTNIKPGNRVTLNKKQPDCIVNLSPGLKGDEKFWKIDAKRKWASNLTKAYVLSTIPLKDDNGDRIDLPKNCLKATSLDENNSPKDEFWLKLEFVESNFSSNSSDRICWIPPDDSLKIPFIVLPQDDRANGGTLTLSCVGCDKSPNRKVELWLE